MIRRICVFAAALLLLLSCCARTEGEYPLSVGSRGEAVREVKERLYELKYYGTSQLTKQYTEDTAERVRLFQRANGLEATGIVDAETAAALFSDGAKEKPKPTMKPLATPAPLPELLWPERDEEGYLAAGDGWFYENPGEGRWIYLGENLQVSILRREDSRISLQWFETDILARNGETLRTVVMDQAHLGRGFKHPEEIAQREKFVLGFSDDFYANRINRKETVGIIIREGRLLSGKTNKKSEAHLPNLDMMAQFPDGSLKVYACNERTGEELLELGAVNVFSFGPWLIRNGEINDVLYTNFKSIEPRHALGMIAPGHYFLVSAEGRAKTSNGTTLQRIAEILRDHGVQEALNLDGGNTMALVFHGQMLNELAVYEGKRFVRTVPSMIGIGYAE